jgi:hypothetical protein
MHQVGFSLNKYNEMHDKQNINPRSKVVFMYNNFTANQILDNVILFLNQMFCFTVLETYFLLVVYSLYRELKGTAAPQYRA